MWYDEQFHNNVRGTKKIDHIFHNFSTIYENMQKINKIWKYFEEKKVFSIFFLASSARSLRAHHFSAARVRARGANQTQPNNDLGKYAVITK